MFFSCEVSYIADVSSFSPSSEQTVTENRTLPSELAA